MSFTLVNCGGRAGAIDIRWRDVPLRDAANRLSGVTGAKAFLDRRLDPTARVELAMRGVPASEVWEQLAATQSAIAWETSGAVYLGPSEAVAALRAAADRRALPTRLRRRLSRSARLTWLRLTEPRGLVEQLVSSRSVRLSNPEAIPHDLWDAGALPAMPASDQLDLLLIGFDLTWRVDPERANTIALVPIERPPRSASPGASERTESRGTPSANEAPRTPTEDLRFTLRVVAQPLDRVLGQIADRVGMPLEIAPDVEETAQQRVGFSVSGATLDDLLAASGRAAGLRVRRVAGAIRVEQGRAQ